LNTTMTRIAFALALALATSACADSDAALAGDEPTASATSAIGDETCNYDRLDAIYWESFGRDPLSFEVDYYCGRMQYNKDMLRWMRSWISSNTDEARATITRSYQAMFHRAPRQAEMDSWLPVVMSKGLSYRNLVDKHAEWAGRHGYSSDGTTYYPCSYDATYDIGTCWQSTYPVR
jgi:hypothetical protein